VEGRDGIQSGTEKKAVVKGQGTRQLDYMGGKTEKAFPRKRQGDKRSGGEPTFNRTPDPGKNMAIITRPQLETVCMGKKGKR